MCETLLPDVVTPEVHQNDHSYVHELSGPTFNSLCKNFGLHGGSQETTKLSKWGVGACAGMGKIIMTLYCLAGIVIICCLATKQSICKVDNGVW